MLKPFFPEINKSGNCCNSILKIEPKYSKFLIERKINSELSYLLFSCFSNDIKKLILPGNIDFKMEMISKQNMRGRI